jgi:hypothetical protein
MQRNVSGMLIDLSISTDLALATAER